MDCGLSIDINGNGSCLLLWFNGYTFSRLASESDEIVRFRDNASSFTAVIDIVTYSVFFGLIQFAKP